MNHTGHFTRNLDWLSWEPAHRAVSGLTFIGVIIMEPCIICSSSEAVRLLEKVSSYSILFCETCRLRFSHPMTHPGQSFYEENKLYGQRNSANVSLSLPALEWRYTTFLKKARPGKGQRLLDVGCGDGGFLSLAESKGLNSFGIEIDSRGVAIARQIHGLRNVEQGRLEKITGLGWKDFDYVTCMEVMEHVSDPMQLARTLCGILRPGGTVGISVPSWDRRPAWFGWPTDYPPHHFTLWTKEALKGLLERAGFVDVEVYTSPVTLQIFLFALLYWLKTARDGGGKNFSQLSEAQAETGTSAEPKVLSEGAAAHAPRVNRKRVALKWLIYAGFNLINPLLRAVPFLRGFTLLAVGRKPGTYETTARTNHL